MKHSQVTRIKTNVVYHNDKFIISDHNYNVQYYPYYQSRMNAMRPLIEAKAKQKWSDTDAPILPLHDIGDVHYDGRDVIIIGTLFKHMHLQPSILKEMSEENQLMPQPLMDRYVSESDNLWLQDGDESIMLSGNIDIGTHVTGICLALIGAEDDNINRFVVKDVCYAEMPLKVSVERPIITDDTYVVIISGLGFSSDCGARQEWSNGIELFTRLIRGELNDRYANIGSAISRVIIAGNCIGKSAREEESDAQIDSKTVVWNRKAKSHTVKAVKLLDDFLEKLGLFIDIDVMPGDLDPSSQLIPQQPFHPCILPKAHKLMSVRCVTNPYYAQYEGIRFLGTSGQNVKSVLQYSDFTDPIQVMTNMLKWAHIAPTAPDTLYSYPYSDNDPFVLTECPDVFFVGNQKEYNSMTVEGPNGQSVLVVSVPDFETKMLCILINLKNLNCEMISFA